MASITARKRKDGTVGYTAQVKVMREGKFVYTKAQTFDREAAAKAWVTKTEKALAKPGGLEAAMAKPVRTGSQTVGELIDAYVKLKGPEIGRTKEYSLLRIKTHAIAEIPIQEVGSQDLVEWLRWLGDNGKRQPQTVQCYMSNLSAVFNIARAAWGIQIDRNITRDAFDAAKHFSLITKSAKRDRRPTVEELDKLLNFFRPKERGTPMHIIIPFAVFSSRRLDEITRIRWEDLEPGRIMVRDMKHPGQKKGNNVWTVLVPQAEEIIKSQPKTNERIFPYTNRSLTTSFTRACRLLGIEDLHFHDLRHEAASRLFEQGWTIPRVAEVTGHRSWQSLQRYSHLRQIGDKLEKWKWQ